VQFARRVGSSPRLIDWVGINESNSAVERLEERKFLGFSISNDESERRMRRTRSPAV